ncbi:hypothetical protein MD484_g2244, partial [Candolleomyces efflorescens]
MGFLKERIKHRQQRDPAKIGALDGVKLFSRYENRKELYIAGVHGITEGGIHGQQGRGAFSVVIAGRYDDDEDHGDIIIYTGEGGHSRDTEMQIRDQDWVRGNAALRTSCARKLPVRVIRSHVLRSKYAPSSGYRYDGLYRVTQAEQVIGKHEHAVCRFVLERLPDQAPLPARGMFDSSSVRRPRPGPSEASTSSAAHVKQPPSIPSLKVESASTSKPPTKKPAFTSHGITFKFAGGDSPPRPKPEPESRLIKAESPTPGASSSTIAPTTIEPTSTKRRTLLYYT